MTSEADSSLGALLDQKVSDSLASAFPAATPRRVFGKAHLPGKATAVVGMRRAGKTTFLHQLRRDMLDTGSAERWAVPYVNFEDERLEGITADHLNPVIEGYYRRYPEARASTRVMWCFDEIQVVSGWERFVRRLLDTEQVDIYVTGSSAALLSREIATALRGRAWEVLMHPFSFEEVLRHSGAESPERLVSISSRQRSVLERSFLDYLEVGGFPEAQGLDLGTRRQLLRDYVDVAMLRDVVERHQVSNVAGLRWLVRHLLGNAAGLFSVEKFYSALRSQGFSISKDTVHQLVGHLTDCFLVRTVWLEARSERQRMVNPRKAYPVDPGLIPVYDRSGRANTGHALETAVLIELERRRCEVTYVRTPEGYEVDFLARLPDGREELIQVCAEASDPTTAERELRALSEAKAQFPRATQRLLILNHDARPRSHPEGVRVQPAYEWMLAAESDPL